MNRFGKIATSVTAVVLVGCITITSVTLLSKKELVVAEDNVSFNGTDALKQMNSAENPLKMIELVPSQDMGELSYVFGQEDWETALKTKNQEERKTYMTKTLYNNWYGLFHKGDSDHTDTMPLAYTEYSEVYALKDGESEADYKQLELGSTEVLSSVNSSGYEMVEEGDYKGDYLFVQPYFVAQKDSEGNYQGQFCQRVSQYIYSEKADQNYEVSFEYVPDQELEETQDLYVASQSKYIASEEQFNKIKEDTPGAYIYCIDYNNMYGPYEFVSQVSKLNYSDLQKGYYYTVGFSHIDKDQVVKGKKYYKIKNVKFVGKPGEDGSVGGTGTGEYAANAGAVYDVAKEDETGYFIEDPTRWMYKYVGQGNGNYHLVRKEGGSIPYDVQIGRVYYKGGYVNNRIWDKYVFNVKAGEEELNYDVATMDPKMLNTYCQKTEIVEGKDEVTALKDIDLLYISSRSLLKENAIEKKTWTGDNKENITFSKTNDITWETARKILLFAKNSEKRMPIIVDRSIINGQDISTYKDSNVTNMQRLVALLSSEQFFHNAGGKNEIEITETTSVDEIKWEELRIPWTKSIGRLYGDEFINQNVFLFYGPNDNKVENPALTPYIFKDFIVDQIAKGNDGATVQSDADFKKLAGNCGVEEIADYIIEENEKRKRENETISSGNKHNLFSLEISKSTMVDYILNFVSKDEVEWDGKLNVLEIQPGKTKNDEPTLTKEMINNLLNQKTSTDTEINIKSMTSAEFVGKIDDLSKYDLIYFGSDTYAFNKENGKTVYNDSANMNGLIYSNIGDIVSFWVEESGNKYSGMLDSDYVSPYDPKTSKELFKDLADQKNQETYATGHNTYRYSGNDLSKETVKKVIDYVKSGCPVLVDKKFYKSDESKTNDKASVDDSLVDNCSYMYELLDTIKTYKNVLTYQGTKTDVDALMKCLLIGKPSLEIENHEKVNNVTDGETNDFDNVVDNIVSQKFKLTNHGAANVNTDFEVKFYLDMNADGKFSPTQEALPALEVELTKNGDTVIPFSRGEGDNTEYYYEIQPGDDNTYKISYELPEGMVGLIPWKLVVAQKDNPLRTVYQQGYFYNAKKSTDDTTTIHILQIDSKSGSTFNMENQLKNKDSLFYKLLHRVKDFDITVRTISSTTYANEYNAFAANHKGKEDKYFEKCCFDINYNITEEADMLIIGFADSYKIENADAMNGIISFINSGKPVLFTHDTTSFNNNRYDTGAWGYQFNSKIRNLVGMDRYGVCASPTLTKGAEISVSTNKTDYDEVSTNAIKKNLDVAYVPKSGKTRIAKQVQGFSYGFITHYLRCGKSSDIEYLIYGNDVLKTDHDLWECSNVQQVNEGQITNYPFAIQEEFNTAYTHTQYYQLDYNEDADRDGESDIVVWYTLSGTDAYTCTPRDVRNNYYIYTKGNVTYSGVGHKSIENQEMELKLYINTMVAAYRSEAKGPKVSLREGPDKDAADLTTLYLSFDEKLGENLESGTKKKTIEEQMLEQGKKSNLVYFTVEDRNIVKNLKEKVVETTFGVLTDLTTETFNNLSEADKAKYKEIEVDNKKAYIEKFEPEIYKLDGTKAVVKNSGVTYCAKIPNYILADDKVKTIYMVARTKFIRKLLEYGNNGQLIENPDKVDHSYSEDRAVPFTVRRMGLTDLD